MGLSRLEKARMRSIQLIVLLSFLVPAAAAPASARPIMIENDLYVPEPEPQPPPPPPAPAKKPPREAAMGAVSAVGLKTPTGTGGLAEYGAGVGLSLTWMSFRNGFGMQAEAMFIDGVEGARFYDLGVSLVAQVPMKTRFWAPFVALGLDVGAVGRSEDSTRAPGLAVGVHGNAGVHGLLSDRVYWRVRGGFVGGAMSGLETSIALGYRFDD